MDVVQQSAGGRDSDSDIGGKLIRIMSLFRIRRRHAMPIESFEELVANLEEATHIMFARKCRLYYHHALIGDIERDHDNRGNVTGIQFYVYQFSSHESKNKEQAFVGRWRVMMRRNEDNDWFIVPEKRVADGYNLAMRVEGNSIRITNAVPNSDMPDKDTLAWNILNPAFGVFPRLWMDRRGRLDDRGRTAAVTRARNCCGIELLRGMYHVLQNNCEHFVTYCLNGEGYSEQSHRRWGKSFYQRAEEAQEPRPPFRMALLLDLSHLRAGDNILPFRAVILRR